MQNVLAIGQWILANYQLLISAMVGLFGAALILALLIPGDQPDKFLQGIVDFLSKFSIKKKE